MQKQPRSRHILLLIVPLLISGVYFRLMGLPLVSGDMEQFLIPWYDRIALDGVKSFSDCFSNYTPPYLYLLAIATLTKSFLPKIAAIKAISICFDLLNFICIYKIVKIKFSNAFMPLLSASVFWAMPTVIMNSTFWGQADAIYTFFLLGAFYLLLKEKSFAALVFYGISISFKAQAVFLAPFLALLTLKKRIPWYYFAIIPVIYILMMVPALLAGRPFVDVLTIYLSQAGTYHSLSLNAPNVYSLISSTDYIAGLKIGLLGAVLVVSAWLIFSMKKPFHLDVDAMAFLALTSVAIVPFSLPKMHDRYFFPADVFSIIVAFLNYNLWFVALLYQIISSLAYFSYFFGLPKIITKAAAMINLFSIVYLLWNQYRLNHPQKRQAYISLQEDKTAGVAYQRSTVKVPTEQEYRTQSHVSSLASNQKFT